MARIILCGFGASRKINLSVTKRTSNVYVVFGLVKVLSSVVHDILRRCCSCYFVVEASTGAAVTRISRCLARTLDVFNNLAGLEIDFAKRIHLGVGLICSVAHLLVRRSMLHKIVVNARSYIHNSVYSDLLRVMRLMHIMTLLLPFSSLLWYLSNVDCVIW